MPACVKFQIMNNKSPVVQLVELNTGQEPSLSILDNEKNVIWHALRVVRTADSYYKSVRCCLSMKYLACRIKAVVYFGYIMHSS